MRPVSTSTEACNVQERSTVRPHGGKNWPPAAYARVRDVPPGNTILFDNAGGPVRTRRTSLYGSNGVEPVVAGRRSRGECSRGLDTGQNCGHTLQDGELGTALATGGGLGFGGVTRSEVPCLRGATGKSWVNCTSSGVEGAALVVRDRGKHYSPC